jgi:hypothetical protein
VSVIVTGEELGLALCNVFGLDPDRVVTITIKCAADEIVKVHVERFITTDEATALTKVLARYELTNGQDVAAAEAQS